MATISKRNLRLTLLPSSSQLRYAMAYITITAVVLFLLNLYTSSTLRSMTFSAQRRSLEEKAQLTVTALLQAEELSAAQAEQIVNTLDDLHTTRTVICDAGGAALFDSLDDGNAQGKYLLFPEIVTALGGSNVFYSVYQDGAVESRCAMPLMRSGRVLGAVYLMDYDTDQGALIAALQHRVLAISLALEGAVVLFSVIFSLLYSRRMRRILNSVRQMRQGDYSYRVALGSNDELDQLGREFNNLTERLAESEARRRQFVSDASHEFKTPLASIKLLSDSILQNEMDPATEREFISDIGREADRLGRLSQKLLLLTKFDSALEEERELIDAAPTVHKVRRMLQPLAQPRNIRIDCTLEYGCNILTVEDDLYQIVFNLAENAIKYNRDGGWVGLELRRSGEQVVLSVADNGSGIPEEARAHIFERFYRVDKARSRAAGGAGLGLSIVHDMVLRNYGSIQVRERPGGGSVFEVRFPLIHTQEVSQ